MKEWFSIIGQGILYVGVFGMYVLGIYHSSDKHNDSEALIWSPFALYRGVEFFFHDYSKEWKAELDNVSYFLENMRYENPPEFNKEFQEFQSKYDEFSSEGKSYLQTFGRNLLNYRISILDDVVQTIYDMEYGDHFILKLSDKTKSLRDKLKEFGMSNHFDFEDKVVDEINSSLNNIMNQVSYEKFVNLKLQSPENINSQKELYQFAFNRIFKKVS